MAGEYARILNYLKHDLLVAIGKKNSNSHKIFGEKFHCFTSDDISYLNKFKNQITGIFVAIPPTESLSWIGSLHNQNLLIEKPGQLQSSKLEELIKYKKNIFIAYNRKFYRTFLDLKTFVNSQKNRCYVHANIPEKKLPTIIFKEKKFNYNVLSNSCHIFSILRDVFGNLNLKNTFFNKPPFYNNIGEFNTITSQGHLLTLSIHLSS